MSRGILPEDIRIYVASEPVDLRASFDRLAAIAKTVLKKNPVAGGLFVFRNREGHRAKALLWDRTGWLLVYKRLENGTFRFPVAEEGVVEIDAEQLRMLLDGIELGVAPRRTAAFSLGEGPGDPGGDRLLDRPRVAQVLPQSPIGEAIRYAAHQWAALVRYVDVGEAEIDNNSLERLLRGAALGRKNCLHFASEGGGAVGAIAYSLIESCKLSGVEPWAYLKDVLMRVWSHPADRIAELMPRSWRPPPDSPNTP